MHIRILGFIALLSLLSPTAWALDLQTAKSQGLVGETPKGYLAPVNNQKPEVMALVQDINNKRRAKYQSIAKQNGTALTEIERLAGQKALGKTQPGHYIQNASGAWVKK